MSAKPDPNSLKTNGLSSIFPKMSELMTGKSWKSLPLASQEVSKNFNQKGAIWCAQLISAYNKPAWQFLRKNKPDILMFYYIAADSTRPGGESTYYDFDYINRNHPEWFLLSDAKNPRRSDANNPENRIRWSNDSKSTSYNRFFLDIGNKDFQKWAANQVVEYVSGRSANPVYGYNGLGVDNVHVGLWYQRLASRCPNWKYAGNPLGWNSDYTAYLKALKSALNQKGYVLILNHSLSFASDSEKQFWPALLDSADGLMSEQAIMLGGKLYSGEQWLKSIQQHEEILSRGLIDWWVCSHPESTEKTYEGFLYTYCSWLLIQKPGKSFYHATKGGDGYSNPVTPWYKEYDLPIGKPLSSRYLKDNCWLRDYEYARIAVNPQNSSQTLTIDEQNYWLESVGRTKIKTLTLPPKSARILLPVSNN